MNTNKIKWLYQQDKNRYHYTFWCHWKSEEEYYSTLEETSYWNFPCIRSKSGIKKIKQINDVCKEFCIKGYSKKKYLDLDPWQDDKAIAWNERKSWKRNSKRKHQWKNK